MFSKLQINIDVILKKYIISIKLEIENLSIKNKKPEKKTRIKNR